MVRWHLAISARAPVAEDNADYCEDVAIYFEGCLWECALLLMAGRGCLFIR